jgi:type II restriction/modification system DNA methylase subunit YeeA
MTLTPQEFVSKWKNSELKERSAYQEHFIDLCRIINHPTPVEKDPIGDNFTFEAGASKEFGGNGFADVWYRGHFAWEYKGRHANMDKAYSQLLQYKDALENPPLLVVSDTDSIFVHTNFTNSVKQVHKLSMEDLLTPKGLNILRNIFFSPESLRPQQTTQHVTEQAAIQFAKLADHLRNRGVEPTKAAHFIIRLLFCLFSEDVGLLPEKLFTRMVSNSRKNPDIFNQQLGQLFQAMSTGGVFGVEIIRQFDGHLFDNAEIIPISVEEISILSGICGLDWSQIEPSILGTLFERSLDPSKRSQLGAHYTSKEDILLIVEPVLMAPLRRQWQDLLSEINELGEKIKTEKGKKRENLLSQLTTIIFKFTDKLANIQILDPACGSGNFLYIALRELLDLWKEVATKASESGLPILIPYTDVSPTPEQLHGIEINIYAHQLAQATIWIGYIQWLQENGFGIPPEPILKPLNNFINMDAILAYDKDGNSIEPEWPKADVIIGNPPFLGDKKMKGDLGVLYVDNLRNLYSNRIPGQSDLVCYWFEKSRELIEKNKVQKVGLLATQAIRGGANRVVLDRITNICDIFWAISDKNWILEGATVHVSMIAFGKEYDFPKLLNGDVVSEIHSDLTAAVNLTSVKPLLENQNLAFIGTQKGGPFDIEQNIAQDFLQKQNNPNGKTNSDVIFPWINGLDITRRNRNMWIIDFGVDKTIEEASQYEAPFEYVKNNVKPGREEVQSEARTSNLWWLFQRPRPEMREALIGLNRYIATARVAKYRLFIWVASNVVPDSAVTVFAREDDYFFGVLHSKLHALWSSNKGTQLREAESGQRYTPSTTFETYPFPWPPGKEPLEDPLVLSISEAAKELVEKRDNWLNPKGASEVELKKRTLTNLYNQNPTWLQLAHEKLDKAVFAAYGWPDNLSDDEILENLLELNLERGKV